MGVNITYDRGFEKQKNKSKYIPNARNIRRQKGENFLEEKWNKFTRLDLLEKEFQKELSTLKLAKNVKVKIINNVTYSELDIFKFKDYTCYDNIAILVLFAIDITPGNISITIDYAIYDLEFELWVNPRDFFMSTQIKDLEELNRAIEKLKKSSTKWEFKFERYTGYNVAIVNEARETDKKYKKALEKEDLLRAYKKALEWKYIKNPQRKDK